MENIKKLKEQAEHLRAKICKLEQEELIKKVMPKALKLIGQCYKYSNSYGSGDDNKPWWLYQKVINVDHICDENRVEVSVKEFQCDCHGDIQFKKRTFSYRDLDYGNDGYQKITTNEYNKEKNKLVKILQKL